MSKVGKEIGVIFGVALLSATVIGALAFTGQLTNIQNKYDSFASEWFNHNSSLEQTSSETSSENQLVTTDINFATTFTGISGTIGKQKSDSVANQKLIVYSNQARIYSGKFIVGKTDGGTTSSYASTDTLDNLVDMYNQVGDIEVKNVGGVSSKAAFCNYLGIQTGNLDSTKALSLKFTYTFDYGSEVNFRIEPFVTGPGINVTFLASLDNGFDRSTYQYITYSDVTNESGKVQQTMTVNLIPFGGENGLWANDYNMFGIAIFGINTDTRLTVNTAQLITTEALPNHGADFTYYVPPVVEGVKVVNANGLAVKNVSTGSDTNNHSFVVINYALTPTNTTDTSLTATVGWVSSAVTDDASLFLTAEIDTLVKTIKVTCLQAFASQMKVVIGSTIDPTKTATITFDVAQKFLGFNGVQELTIPHFYNGKAFARNFYNEISDSTLITKLTNGFTSVFTTGVTTTPTISNYQLSDTHMLLISDEWDETYSTIDDVFVEDENLPQVDNLTATEQLFDYNFNSYPGTVATESNFIAALNDDASHHMNNAQISFLKNTATYVALKTIAHINLTVGGLTSTIQIDYLAIVATSRLTLNIPLQSISPEVGGFTF